jgi:hypothetical protein
VVTIPEAYDPTTDPVYKKGGPKHQVSAPQTRISLKSFCLNFAQVISLE